MPGGIALPGTTMITKKEKDGMVNCARNGSHLALLCLVLLAPLTPNAFAVNLLTNGDFEATPVNARPPGWTLFEQAGSIGRFYLDQPGTTAPSFDPGYATVTPSNDLIPGGGTTYAVSTPTSDTVSQAGPAAHALSQSFSVPGTASSIRLNFQMFLLDTRLVGEQADPSGLDYTSGGSGRDNQQRRVDILRAGSAPLSTAAPDVVDSFTLGNPGELQLSNWTQFDFDLAGVLKPGQQYTLRFATVSNKEVIVMGVDNVAINYEGTGVVPEGGTPWLFIPPALWLLTRARRRRH